MMAETVYCPSCGMCFLLHAYRDTNIVLGCGMCGSEHPIEAWIDRERRWVLAIMHSAGRLL